ncbi:DegV family protein [Butyrivibrio sp.]|uniref:DegV family protein n=1 Tax=Butyrivibrio sp. TaxID=28121 RepID=UPI002FE6DB8D
MLRNPRRKRTEAHNCLGKIMIKILSDSTCDLSPELIQKYDIGIIPLYVRLGDVEYLDGVNILAHSHYIRISSP